MKIRRAQGRKVTNHAAAAPLSGLAVLALALVPHHAASAPHATGVTSAGTDQTPAAVDAYRVRALIATERHHSDAALPMYAVRSGDNLSEIAAGHCEGKADDWTGIYAASHLKGSANVIQPGQELAVSCTYDAAELGKATTAGSSTRVTSANTAATVQSASSAGSTARHDQFDGNTQYECGDGDGDGAHDMPCSLLHGGSSGAHRHTAVTVSSGGYSGNIGTSSGPGGSFGACVVSRESGGNSQVMNASGHYGLYQFSASTWVAYGGSSADFGHASVAEQERVFSNALAQGGESNWSPYDGC